MESVRQGFLTFSSRVRGFFGGICQSPVVSASAHVDLSGTRLIDISGVYLSGSIVTVGPVTPSPDSPSPVTASPDSPSPVTSSPDSPSPVTPSQVTEEVKTTSTLCSKAASEIEDSAQCKECDCSVNTIKGKSGLKLLVPSASSVN